MRFELKAKCTFSGKPEPAEADVEATMARAAPLLSKGAPRGKEAEAARIVKWSIVGKELEVEIESGRYVRAHDALLRLIKLLGEELGKKHKLGIRTIEAPEYRITLPSREIPEEAMRELKKLPCEIKAEKQAVSLILHDLSEADLRGRIVDRLVSMAEDTGGLDRHVDFQLGPRQPAGIGLGKQPRLLTAGRQPSVVEADRSGIGPVHRVVTAEIGQGPVIGQVVDRHDLDVLALAEDAKNIIGPEGFKQDKE